MRGTVVSDKAQKSVVVAVERIYKHPVVHKFIKTRSKFMAHDELDQFQVSMHSYTHIKMRPGTLIAAISM